MKTYPIYQVKAKKKEVLSNAGISPSISVHEGDRGTFQLQYAGMNYIIEAKFNGKTIRMPLKVVLQNNDIRPLLTQNGVFEILPFKVDGYSKAAGEDSVVDDTVNTPKTDVLTQINKDVLALQRKVKYGSMMTLGLGFAAGGLASLSAKQSNTKSYVIIVGGIVFTAGALMLSNIQKAKDEGIKS